MQLKNRPGSAIAILTICFCLWHMFAVAVYLLPADSLEPMKTMRGLSVPYVLALSQWQKWDIFSPNPLRRNSVYIVERDAGDRFETAMIMDFQHLAWYERAKELKVLGRLQDSWKKLASQYLLSLCPRIPDSSGTQIRLLVSTSILPKDLPALRRVSSITPAPSESLLASVRCPHF